MIDQWEQALEVIHQVDTRYNSAMMDVILDLGYVLIYLVMVVLGMSELSLKPSAGGNFGDLESRSPKLPPAEGFRDSSDIPRTTITR